MSPRAAWRLESLGFTQVYDYAAGKADWFARGGAIVGTRASAPRIGGAAQADVPTARLDESIEDVATRVRESGWSTCIGVNEDGVVLGRLFKTELEASDGRPVHAAMRSGPSTFRPNVTVEEMTGFMERHDLSTALVTTSDGRLVGLFQRDGERR